MKELNQYFENIVDLPRIRVGHGQTLETMINEEALVFPKFIRREKQSWIPRVTV